MKEVLSIIADFSSVLVALLAIGISIWTYIHGLNRERRVDTIESLRRIRTKYFNTKSLSDKEKLQYLNEMEYFATGINSQIYDIEIANKMSGGRLISQYKDWCENFIEERKSRGSENAYSEYKRMIDELKKMREGK